MLCLEAIQSLNDHAKWIPITKQKLKEREALLLNIKVEQINIIIKNALCAVYDADVDAVPYKVSNNIISRSLHRLHDMIGNWNGLDESESEMKTAKTFRDYFIVAKHMWDQKKRHVFGSVFWIHMFMHIHQLPIERRLILRTIKALFRARNRCNYLSPSLIGIEVVASSNTIHRYLRSINHSVSINRKNNKMSIHSIKQDKINCIQLII